MRHLRSRVHGLRRLLAAALLLAAPAAFAGAPGFTPVALQRHDAGTFYVDGAIAGYGDIRLLVDTGSSYLVLNETILEQLKVSGGARYTRNLEGMMADGTSRVIPLYSIDSLRLGENCWVHDVEAAVIPGSVRPILGMNILSRLAPFTFSADPPELGVAQCQLANVAVVDALAPVAGRDGDGISQ